MFLKKTKGDLLEISGIFLKNKIRGNGSASYQKDPLLEIHPAGLWAVRQGPRSEDFKRKINFGKSFFKRKRGGGS
jgi:hypothetical protein